MLDFRETRIAAQNVKSLCWQEKHLVDWVNGGNVYHLDGSTTPRHVHYAYRFDAAVVSPSGEFAVIYERLGTTALVLQRGEILRQLRRSFYYAHAYEYPVAFIQLADGRELLAHCPERYCQIELEDARTGEHLTTTAAPRHPVDFFHSRLTASPNGRWLLSAGWVWHPWDVIALYPVEQALADPTMLDGWGVGPRTAAEVYAATFRDDETLLLVTSDEADDEEDEEEEGDEEKDVLWRAGPRLLACYDLGTQTQSVVRAEAVVGKLMSLGPQHVVGFHEHPKLFELATGKVVHRWPELTTGSQTSSIQWRIGPVPPLAIDSAHRRFAVAGSDAITVIEIVDV